MLERLRNALTQYVVLVLLEALALWTETLVAGALWLLAAAAFGLININTPPFSETASGRALAGLRSAGIGMAAFLTVALAGVTIAWLRGDYPH